MDHRFKSKKIGWKKHYSNMSRSVGEEDLRGKRLERKSADLREKEET